MSDSLYTERKTTSPPNCLKCAFFKVTWDSFFPRACEIFSIKCSNLPSHEVFRATGANCPSFRLKEGLKQ
jgi:hypothetical protein